MILDRFKRFVSDASAASESDSSRDGLFSYRSETHAFTWGLGLGLLIVLCLAFAREHLRTVLGAAGTLVSYAFLDRGQKARDAPVPESVAREAEKEPQYLLGGLVSGVVFGLIVVLAVLAVL